MEDRTNVTLNGLNSDKNLVTAINQAKYHCIGRQKAEGRGENIQTGLRTGARGNC